MPLPGNGVCVALLLLTPPEGGGKVPLPGNGVCVASLLLTPPAGGGKVPLPGNGVCVASLLLTPPEAGSTHGRGNGGDVTAATRGRQGAAAG